MTVAAYPTPTSPPGRHSTFQIRRSERVLFVGRTGSGKTTLADRLIRTLGYRTVVIDPKHLWEFPGYRLVDRYDPDTYVTRQVFRPVDDDRREWRDTQTFLESVWYGPRQTIIYVDELTRLSTPRKTVPILADFIRLGRQLGFGVWTASQRPRDIPTLFLSETEHFFVFDLRTPGDREKVADFLGPSVEQRIKEDYAFWYSHPSHPDPILVHQNGGNR